MKNKRINSFFKIDKKKSEDQNMTISFIT